MSATTLLLRAPSAPCVCARSPAVPRRAARAARAAFAPKATALRSSKAFVVEDSSIDSSASSRRRVGLGMALLLAGAAPALGASGIALAEGDFQVLYGLDTPPASYGGYGGNAKEAAKYTFEYPTSWKRDKPNKVEKGTQGIDSRVISAKKDNQRAFVITLARAGEDDKMFRLTDVDSTLLGFAGADYYLQDALVSSTNKKSEEREVDGIKFFDYDIDSPDFRYLASVAVKKGKIFALFVRSPTKTYKTQKATLKHIQESFKLL